MSESISITDHKAALVSQQAEFDQSLDALKAQVVEKDAIIADLTDFKTRAESGISAIVAAVQDPRKDAEATVEAVLKVISEGTAPEAARKRAEIEKQIADLEAQL